MKKSCKKIKKLSEAFPAASLDQAKLNLKNLEKMVQKAAEAGEEIGQVISCLRKIPAQEGQPFIFTPRLQENEQLLRNALRDCDDIKFRKFMTGNSQNVLLIYLDGMTDLTLLEKNVIERLMPPEQGQTETITVKYLENALLTSASVTVIDKATEAIEGVMTGNALLIVDKIAKGFNIGTTKAVKRSVSEPVTEDAIRSPHDAFNETLNDNLILIRRRTRDINLKIRIVKVGQRSQTAVALVYSANLVKPGLLEEVQRRIEGIKVDVVMLSATIEEYIVDHPWSPFPQVQVTERPDKIINAVYDGRVAILVDNTPYALAVPCTYNMMMQSVDDYTIQPVVSSLVRLTRNVSAFMAIYLPAVYVAVVSYHPGMLPTTLAISIAELRSRTPFPSFLEAIMMEILLELFQEAVVRLPKKISGAASMVGGFVIGTTVVQAGLINPLLVVVVATTAIASYSMPSYSFSMSLRWLRVPMLILASILGLYGVMLGILAITVHAVSLRSFGESYLGGFFNVEFFSAWKDTLVRLPSRLLRYRPEEMGAQERGRKGDWNG